MIGQHVKIKEMKNIVSELWGRRGVIIGSREIDNEDAREFYKRTKNQCPDEIEYQMLFDEVIKEEGNLKGWKGVWITSKDQVEEL